MADARTRRQKIQDLLDGATTPGEKAAAQAALDRLPPEPEPAHHRPSIARKHEWTADFTRGPVNASSFGRSRTYTTGAADFADAFTQSWRTDPYCPHGAIKGLCQICNPAPNQKRYEQKTCEHGRIVEGMGSVRCAKCDQEAQVNYRAPEGEEAKPAGRQGRFNSPEEELEYFQARERLRRDERDAEIDRILHRAATEPVFRRASDLVNDWQAGKININKLREELGKEPL